jgi:hypothetical protein
MPGCINRNERKLTKSFFAAPRTTRNHLSTGMSELHQKRVWHIVAEIKVAASVSVFVLFGLHINSGGSYEMRTVITMTARCSIRTVIALFS